MTLFDLAIVVLVLILAVGGYNLGFVARVTSWIGVAIGIAVAAFVAPRILDSFRLPDPTSNLVLVAGVFIVIASMGGAVGTAIGAQVRRSIPYGPAQQLDQAGGAAAGAVGAIILVWLLLPAVQDATPEISREVRGSAIARFLDDVGPRAPRSLQALRQRVSEANFPKVFDDLRRTPSAGPPPAGLVLDAALVERVKASTVRVSGTACGRVMEGSGFSPSDDVVVTNAHVVAGVGSVTVLRSDGRRLSGRVNVFDPQRDLAVVVVPGLNARSLPVASAEVGDEGAVFGHPAGQVPVDVQPYRVNDRRTAVGRDIYNAAVTRRDVLFLAANLAPGDSGGALVNAEGAVVGVAFAIAPDQPGAAFALSDDELRPVLAQPRGGAVSTGRCVG